MVAERGIEVDHATVGRLVVRYSPELRERFNWRKRPATKRWYVDETYIRVRGRWMYLYRTIDSNGALIVGSPDTILNWRRMTPPFPQRNQQGSEEPRTQHDHDPPSGIRRTSRPLSASVKA